MANVQSRLVLSWLVVQQWLQTPRIELAKNVLFIIVVYRLLSRFLYLVRLRGPVGLLVEWKQSIIRILLNRAKQLPGVRNKIQSELDKVIKKIQDDVAPVRPGETRYLQLPKQGFTAEQIHAELEKYHGMAKVDWKDGRISGAVYHGNEALSNLCVDAYRLFSVSNPLHPEVFPGVRKMEAEAVAMVLDMYHAPPSAGGVMTSGGTESLLMACKAYRDWARHTKGITEPEMVVPVSIHAAFDKAAGYFGIRMVQVPVNQTTFQVDVDAVRRAINRNTIMLAGSAPNFPYGTVDDIAALARLAKRHGIGMHVDCCLGGFIAPFMEKAGFHMPPFDFRVEGVTSISCDTHKYGFAPKGTSVIMYRSKQLRSHQYTVTPAWTGGVYASPSVAGSRPGALIAACWTALMSMGEAGYVETTRAIVECARRIANGIDRIDGLRVLGRPIMTALAFAADAPLNVHAINDAMSRRGWHLSSLQHPDAVHISCTLLTVGRADDLCRDLQAAVDEVRADPSLNEKGQAAIYGMAATIPDKSIIGEVAKGFVDALYIA
ncbi:pyridoxal phosphate-dependent transferase [Syncephalis pseudoplumigaleata]|uniref:sphinganine-1-phosphate aldolase n=1 Tax=Syncephalis pseudoplumigaleata TaxID=1712513 RepID=A0A4P9YZ10_9FUNG|nr:pyridoxal phosphate-dependent transferase [Syncephalis pseudoplumigaleata]|eukprot:RKP24621.1 pyridoxal phosphate-dependent transferase [Syncephalis pseudoplumigaleata]